MSRVADIDRYLRANLAAQQTPGAVTGEPRVRPFVTISRQAGVGGHALGDVIVEAFSAQPDQSVFGGWRVYDRTLCEMVAADPRYEVWLDALVDEEYLSKANDFFHQMLRSAVDQKLVMNRVFLAVRSVAGIGKAVIIGRAGSHVTRDMPQGVSLRVVASEDHRIRRTMDVHTLSDREARARMSKRDADRARLLRAHFRADIDDPTGYDATFNAGLVSFEEIAECAAAMVQARANLPVCHGREA
jgi:cytidylate kinase